MYTKATHPRKNKCTLTQPKIHPTVPDVMSSYLSNADYLGEEGNWYPYSRTNPHSKLL